MGSARVHIAVLSISPASATAVAIESVLADAVTAAGHDLTAFEVVRDTEVAIRAQLVGLIADPDIDVVIILAGGEATAIALAPLVDQALPGFGDLLRVLSDQEGAIYNDAEVVRCDSTFVFVLPAHANAVRAVMEQLILPQLDARTERNLLPSLPRLSEATRVDVSTIDATLAAEARKLPGRARKPTGKNVIARKVDDPTKPIDLDKLEHQLALSKTTDQVTRSIDLDKLQHQLEATRAVGDSTKPMDLGKSAIPIRSKNPIGVAKSAAPATATAAQPARAKSPSGPLPSASQPTRPKSPSGPLPSVVARSDASERSSPPLSSTIGTRKVSPASPAEPAPRGRPTTGSPPPPASPGSTATTAPYPAQPAPTAATAATAPYPAQPAPAGTPALHPAPPTPATSSAATAAPTTAAATDASSPTPAATAPRRSTGTAPPPATATDASSPTPAATAARRSTGTAPPPATATDASSPTPAAAPPPATATDASSPTAAATAPRRSTGTAPPPPPDLAEPADWVETIDPDELHEEPDVVEPSPVVERPQPAPVASPAPAAASPAPRSAPGPAPSFAELAPTAYADDSFEVPSLRRSRTPLVLGLLFLALVLGGGGAYLAMRQSDDAKLEQVAQANADAAEPGAAPSSQPEVDAAVVAAVAIDAAEPAPEIEIEPEPVASKPAPEVARKTPRRDKRKAAPDTEPAKPTPDEPDPAKTAPDTEPAPKRGTPGCEEVECVLEAYKRPCCARYKPADDGFKPSTVPAENLQKTQIKAGIAKVRAKVMACGEQFATKGTVKLSITVDPEGQISELDVVATPDDALGSCVAAAVRTATFAKTEGGGSFTQPFVF